MRLPGDIADADSLWQALMEGRDQVTRIGAERWQVEELSHPVRAEPGRSISFKAGVLSQVEHFDAAFFGISPREAGWMDPQQRLLLELAWEAMENAACPPSRLAGTQCAVYVGISGLDYGMRRLDDLASLSAHTMTGNTLSIAANRLSYAFDLRGPSLAVDTACSSSLVALHHACRAIADGEASSALVAGVNLLLHPYPFIGFTKASMLSEHGRCASFDAAGDGYVRSEGAVVLLLKPLEQALADGDPIEAVIRASGINADGARKAGITIPSHEGQAELMRAVLARSGLQAGDLDYLEAHGTGTLVGDPIESAAIGAVYGAARSADQPLPIGSIKSNLGHLEPASGLAGLLKAMLVIRHGVVPPTIHLSRRNPHIDFDGLHIDPVSQARPLPARTAAGLALPRRGAVNSFGFGGANAHVVLESAPARSAVPVQAPLLPPPLVLSTRNRAGLAELAGRYAMLLRRQPADPSRLHALVSAAALNRDWLEQRMAVPAVDHDQLLATLERVAGGESVAGVVEEAVLPGETGLAFVYSGNGAQWVGMGLALLAESPEFADHLRELDAAIAAEGGFSLLEELQRDPESTRIADTAIAQPLLFAIQVALTRMLLARGVRPTVVLGHSVGEVAAAWASGALGLDQAVRVICARSAAQAMTAGAGRMAAVSCSVAEAIEMMSEAAASAVEIAAFNAPSALTLSGPLVQLEAVHLCCRRKGRAFRLLDLDYAFHNAAMDPARDTLLARLSGLVPRGQHRLRFISTVHEDLPDAAALGPGYWWDNIRRPVQFQRAVEQALDGGCRVLIEIGPHPILQRYLNEVAAVSGTRIRTLPSLRRQDDGLVRVEEAALRALLLQGPAACAPLFAAASAPFRLPNYPWQREPCRAPASGEGSHLLERRRVHPLLGWRVHDAEAAWENVLDLRVQAWLADHAVAGAAVLPGAAYAELALAAAREWTGQAAARIENLDILAPLVFDREHGRTLRFDLQARDHSFQIRSRQRLSEDPWVIHAAGRLAGRPAHAGMRPSVAASGAEHPIDRELHYRLVSSLGLEYGPAFQCFAGARRDGDLLHGELADAAQAGSEGMLLPPALLDACFQALVGYFQADIEAGRGLPLLPVRMGELHFHGGAVARRFEARLIRRSRRSVLVDFVLFDAAGLPVAVLSGCRFRAAVLRDGGQALPAAWEQVARLVPLPGTQGSTAWPAVSRLNAELRDWLRGQESQLKRGEFHQEALPLFDALVVSAAYHAVRALQDGDPVAARMLLDGTASGATGLAPFRGWLVALLQRQELLTESAEGPVLAGSDLPPAQEIWRTLLRDYPASVQELVLAGRVITRLPALLSGAADAEGLAREIRDSQQQESVYCSSYAYAGGFQALTQLLRSLAAGHPQGRRLRILEVAPGSGSLATSLAGQFAVDRLDYVLARPLGGASLHADEAQGSFVTTVQLAVDGQGFVGNPQVPEHFDLVILRHSLHASGHPVALLGWLRQRMAAGALLVVAERSPDLVVDFYSGLDPAWWRHASDDAAHSRLLSRATWESLLEAQGFGEVSACLEHDSSDDTGGVFLLLAKNPTSRAATEPPRATPEPARWLLLTGGERARACARGLAERLRARGHAVMMSDVALGTSAPGVDAKASPVPAIAAAVAQGGPLEHFVDLTALDIPPMAAGVAATSHLELALAMVHALRSLDRAPRIWWVLPGGAPQRGLVGAAQRNPELAASWGFARVLANEWPESRPTLIDSGGLAQGQQLAAALEAELLDGDEERERVLVRGIRYGLRLKHAPVRRQASSGSADDVRFRLDFDTPGQLRKLRWDEAAAPPLGDDQVEVRTVAAGLNFRDVMYAMGLLPDEAVENGFSGASLGLEFSGVVSRVGRRVETVAVGDPVMGFGPACFASHVVTSANAVTHKPDHWSFESAATVPTAFFTVYYALRQLANLQPGERVLVHGAAGGVGMAAVELARYLKAEVFATAGSDERRDFVHLLGADHVFDSRSTAFADQVLAATGGEGVDVVLNSLAGEAIRRNLQVLKPFGRFLELGKRDFFENTPIGLRPFRNNISYFGIDADQLLSARPALAARMFREVMALFRGGVLTPLPFTAFRVRQVVEAFRFMQQSRQIGKVVVRIDEAPDRIRRERPRQDALRFRADRSYLVTGGIQGFGLETARWMAARGAGELVLVGRRGAQTPGAGQAVEQLRALGARVVLAACDVADRDAVDRLFHTIAREHLPLAGIVHAAMQLDDALVEGLDAERLRIAMRPKWTGAWNLHAASLELPLEHFILYSSVTTTLGNPGQGNYVAANCALEALACLRLDMGLPALCVGWGPIEDAGYLTRNAAVRERLVNRIGVRALDSATAMHMLELLLRSSTGVAHVADVDWAGMAARLPLLGTPRLRTLAIQAAAVPAVGEGAEAFRAMIAGRTPEQVLALVVEQVTHEVAQILAISPDRVDSARLLQDMGLDSLMGVELGMGLEKRFGIQLPAMMLSEGPSIERLAARIVELVAGGSADQGPDAESELSRLVSGLAAQHGERVSEDEIRATVAAVRQRG